jgi:Tfp pilus assembly protein FimT
MSKARQGKSLVELLVVVSVLSIVIGMSATSLATLYRLHRRYARDVEQALAIDRLAARLRADAHEAARATVDGDFVLNLADGRSIRYSFEPPRIIRQVKRDDSLLHRDTFAMPRDAVVAFENEEVAAGMLIRLSIRPGELKMPARELPRSATIEASVASRPSMGQIARQP